MGAYGQTLRVHTRSNIHTHSHSLALAGKWQLVARGVRIVLWLSKEGKNGKRVGGTRVLNASLATNYSSESARGTTAIDWLWHTHAHTRAPLQHGGSRQRWQQSEDARRGGRQCGGCNQRVGSATGENFVPPMNAACCCCCCC